MGSERVLFNQESFPDPIGWYYILSLALNMHSYCTEALYSFVVGNLRPLLHLLWVLVRLAHYRGLSLCYGSADSCKEP